MEAWYMYIVLRTLAYHTLYKSSTWFDLIIFNIFYGNVKFGYILLLGKVQPMDLSEFVVCDLKFGRENH